LRSGAIALGGGGGYTTDRGSGDGATTSRATPACHDANRSADERSLRGVRVQRHFLGTLHDTELHAGALSDTVRRGFAPCNRGKRDGNDPEIRSIR
jgi:hypothetical protein